jgi:hypothetical protein
MPRLMGDAIHDNVPALAQVPGLQLVAGYVTGSPDILWPAADWARFPGIQRVWIDQGFTYSPVPMATVRDVEPGAWLPQDAVKRAGWTAGRPTIYCDRNDLSREGGVLQSGWRGDLWLAWPGWTAGTPLPTAPGCTYVAVQNQLGVGNAYDLSIVLDPFWPLEAPVSLTAYQPGSVSLLYSPDGKLNIVGTGQDNRVYMTPLNADGTAGTPVAVTFPLTFT